MDASPTGFMSAVAQGVGSTGFDMRAFILTTQVFALITLVTFIYTAFALYSIAKAAKKPYPWLAFVPFANLYLIHTLARKPVWMLITIITFTVYLLSPLAFPLAFPSIPLILAILVSIWFADLAERRGYHAVTGSSVPVLLYLAYSAFSNAFVSFSITPNSVLPGLIIMPLLFWSTGMVIFGIIAWREPQR
ncbi:MAG: hypothetical protein ACMXYM_01680 [Candidatus Woesearchaeota archaeon]